MLVKCLECQKDVSDRADHCPHCGFPVMPNFTDTVIEKTGAATDTMMVVTRRGIPKIKKGFLFAGAFFGCFLVWFAGTAFMLSIVATNNRNAIMLYRPLVSFLCLWASRLWILAAAKLWPENGERIAKGLFKAGFWLMTFKEIVILPDFALFLICQVARLGGYVFALYGMNYKPESSVGQNDAVVIEKGVD